MRCRGAADVIAAAKAELLAAMAFVNGWRSMVAATGAGKTEAYLALATKDVFAALVRELDSGGVYLNVGSAVILPEVFLKALTIARNTGGGRPTHFVAADFTTDFVKRRFDLVLAAELLRQREAEMAGAVDPPPAADDAPGGSRTSRAAGMMTSHARLPIANMATRQS